MREQVKLVAPRRRYQVGGETSFGIELPSGATIADLLAQLGLPQAEAKVVFVNGRARPLDWPLAPNDEVGIFPPIGGG